jgi:hypothetical protein
MVDRTEREWNGKNGNDLEFSRHGVRPAYARGAVRVMRSQAVGESPNRPLKDLLK